jgi:hypothetical protein
MNEYIRKLIRWKSYKKLWKDAAKFAAIPHEGIACPFSGLVPIKENLI